MNKEHIRPENVIEAYEKGDYIEGAKTLLGLYEQERASVGVADSTLWNKFGRPDIVQRLGYEMFKNPELYGRLRIVASCVLQSERFHLLWLVPELLEDYLPEDKKELYRWNLESMMKVFGADSLGGVINGFDEANKLGITPRSN